MSTSAPASGASAAAVNSTGTSPRLASHGQRFDGHAGRQVLELEVQVAAEIGPRGVDQEGHAIALGTGATMSTNWLRSDKPKVSTGLTGVTSTR